MVDKQFKTVDEQIGILKSRNLTFNRPVLDKKLLTKTNYYTLTGYKNLLIQSKNPEIYKHDATFEELYSLYTFDRKLKMLVLELLLEIEQEIKTIIAHEYSKKYYNDRSTFSPDNFNLSYRKTNDTLKQIEKEIRKMENKNQYLQHYSTRYKNTPLWVSIKVLTFGRVNDFYYILKSNDKDVISKKILKINITKNRSRILYLYIRLMKNIRNVCAHDEMFFNFNHKGIKIPITNFHGEFNLKEDSIGVPVSGRGDMFALLIVLKYFVSKGRYKKFMNKFDSVVNKQIKKSNSFSSEELLREMNLPLDYQKLKDL